MATDKKPDIKHEAKSGQAKDFEEIVRLNSNEQFVQNYELNAIQRPTVVAPPPPQISLAPQPSSSIQRTLVTSSSLPPQENKEQAVKIENIVSFRCLYAYYLFKNYLTILKPHLEGV